jgi:hypothetical protein
MDSLCLNKIETGRKCNYCHSFENITLSNTQLIDFLNADREKVISENLDVQEIFMNYIVGLKPSPELSTLYNRLSTERYEFQAGDLKINSSYFEAKVIDPKSYEEVRRPVINPDLQWTTLKLNINPEEHVFLPGLLLSLTSQQYDLFVKGTDELKFVIPKNISIRFKNSDIREVEQDDSEFTLPNLSSHFDTTPFIGKVVTFTGASTMRKIKESLKGSIFDKYQLACRSCEKVLAGSNEKTYQYICLHNESNVEGKNFTCYMYRLRDTSLFDDISPEKVHLFLYFGIWAKKEIRDKPAVIKTVKDDIFTAITKGVMSGIHTTTGIDVKHPEIVNSIKSYKDLGKFVLEAQRGKIYSKFHDAFKMIVVKPYPDFVKNGQSRRNVVLSCYLNLWFLEEGNNREEVRKALESQVFAKSNLICNRVYKQDDFRALNYNEQLVFFAFFFYETSELFLLSVISEKFSQFIDGYKAVAMFIGLDIALQGAKVVDVAVSTSAAAIDFLLKMTVLFAIKEFAMNQFLTRRGYNRISSQLMLSVFSNKRDIPELDLAFELSKKGVSDIKYYYLLDAMSRDDNLAKKFGIPSNLIHHYNIESARDLYARAKF